MGINTSAKLIYGCNYSDLPEEILEEVNEMLDVGELDYASPYYDAPRDEWIVGVGVDVHGLSHYGMRTSLSEAIIRFEETLWHGVVAYFYVTPHVS